MANRTERMQAGIAREGTIAAMSLEWDLRDDPRAAWEALKTLDPPGAVIGFGAPWAEAVGAKIPGLAAFQRKQGGDIVMPASQHALWAYVMGDTPGDVFTQADKLVSALGSVYRLAESTPLLRYRDGRDLLGYRDGTENPKGDDAWDAALVPDGEWAGGSFALVQRYIHARSRFAELSQAERDNVIGRTETADEELEDAPDTAHVKRTAQEDFDPPAFMLRRSMPWGDARRHGLQFVAFVADLDRVERQLNRMLGLTDGVRDALMRFTQAETGAYYFCPPVAKGRLVLPAYAGGPATKPTPGIEVAESSTIRIRFEAKKCIHSRHCVLGRPDVFVPNVKGEWIHPENATAEEVAELAHQCPSGAIQYDRFDGVPGEQPPRVNLVRLRQDGPLALHGEFTVGEGRHIRAALCRCGASRNKPFCDTSHSAAKFAATGEPGTVESKPLETRGGPVSVTPRPNGPLVFSGPVEIVSGTGRTVNRVTGTALCRCGQSANKPFCDGTHAKVEFRSDT